MIHRHLDIVTTPNSGRAVVAKAPIKAGTRIILEDPIACAPFATSTLDEVQCESGRYRYSRHEELMQSSSQRSFHMCILASRLYNLSKSQPEQQSELRNHVVSSADPEGLLLCGQIVQRLVQQSGHVISVGQCCELINTLACNVFTLVDDFNSESGLGIYAYASMLNHSCAPNCVQRFDQSGRIIVRTMADVPTGEELCISYIDPCAPTWHRRSQLMSSYFFHCICARCDLPDTLDGFNCFSEHSFMRPRGSCTGVCYLCTGADSTYRSWLSGYVPCPESTSTDEAAPAPAAPAAVSARASIGAVGAVGSTGGVGAVGALGLPLPYFDILGPLIASGGTVEARVSEEWGMPRAPGIPRQPEIAGPMTSESGSVTFKCCRCGVSLSTAQVAARVAYVLAMYTQRPPAFSSARGISEGLKRMVSIRKLHELHWELQLCARVLAELERLVPKHHYCIFAVRRRIKEAFERLLPTYQGVLLFPPLRLSVPPVDAGAGAGAVVGAGAGAGSSKSRGAKAIEVSVTAQELQLQYQKNLEELIACEGVYANGQMLPPIFTRIQYMWFLPTRSHSLLSHTGAPQPHPLSSEIQGPVEATVLELRSLMERVRVVYGEDHAFHADLQGRYHDIGR